MISPSPQVSSNSPRIRQLAPQRAHDFEHWASRLINPGQLEDSAAITIFHLPLLAVPVGKGASTENCTYFMSGSPKRLWQPSTEAGRWPPAFEQRQNDAVAPKSSGDVTHPHSDAQPAPPGTRTALAQSRRRRPMSKNAWRIATFTLALTTIILAAQLPR
jgi:hypothetical protein